MWAFGEQELENRVASSCSLLSPMEHDCQNGLKSFLYLLSLSQSLRNWKMVEITSVEDRWLERSGDAHVMSLCPFFALSATMFHPFLAIYYYFSLPATFTVMMGAPVSTYLAQFLKSHMYYIFCYTFLVCTCGALHGCALCTFQEGF